ncbi:MAG: hypothetical protein ACI8R4_001276 [Paracoccaceae bacterium]|jgi:hypothetical protein
MQILNIQGQTLSGSSLSGEKPYQTHSSAQAGRAFGDVFAERTALAGPTSQTDSPEDERELLAQETEAADGVGDQNSLGIPLDPENVAEPAALVAGKIGRVEKPDSAPELGVADSPKSPDPTTPRQDAPPHWPRMASAWQSDIGLGKTTPSAIQIGTIAPADSSVPSNDTQELAEPKIVNITVGQGSIPAIFPKPNMSSNGSRSPIGKVELSAAQPALTGTNQPLHPTMPSETPFSALPARSGAPTSGSGTAQILLPDSGQHTQSKNTIRMADTPVGNPALGPQGFVTVEAGHSVSPVTAFKPADAIGVKHPDTGVVKAEGPAYARPAATQSLHISEAVAIGSSGVSPLPDTAQPMVQQSQLPQATLGSGRSPATGTSAAPDLTGAQISHQARVRPFGSVPARPKVSDQDGVRLAPIPVNQTTRGPEVRKPDSPATTFASLASAEPVSPIPTDRTLSEIPSDPGKQTLLSFEPISGAATSAAATAPMARYETARLIAAQMADGFPNQPGRPVEISLNPEELGRVRMVLSTTDTGVSVSITTDRPETLDLMRRHADQLSAELRRMGYQDIGFDFGGGSAGRFNHNNNDSLPDHLAGPTSIESETSKPAQTARNAAPGGLDLRL